MCGGLATTAGLRAGPGMTYPETADVNDIFENGEQR